MRYVDLGQAVEKHQNIRAREEKAMNKRRGGVPVVVLVIFLLVIGGLVLSGKAGALFDPVSIVSNITSPNLDETDGRTNVLLLGLDKRITSSEQEVLTDTLLFASIGRVEGNVAMISLPRDLWVKVKANADRGEHFVKINAVYAEDEDGMEELERITEEVLGMPVHYYAVVDFNLFKDTIDILGGIDIDVDKSFDDSSFPVEGMEKAPNIEDRYETIHFDAGSQTMDGDIALKYVRSRKGNNEEGSDFARSRRQQKVIMAIKDKLLSLKTLVNLPKLKELYDAYSANVDTDVGFEEIQGFYLLSQLINFNSVRSIVLDDRSGANEGGLLYHPTDTSLYGEAYVLVPKAEDYSQLHAYVQRYIFGE
jgi:LCP family protein required for cell wall assembly